MSTSLKICRRCHAVLPLNEFYRHSQMADGHLNHCKNCVRSRVAHHRSANLDRVRAYDRTRGTRPERRADNTARTMAARRANKARQAAHNAVARAVTSGRLTPQPCCVCGSLPTEAHHHDYSKKLAVTWLCPAHHRQLHRGKLLLPLALPNA